MFGSWSGHVAWVGTRKAGWAGGAIGVLCGNLEGDYLEHVGVGVVVARVGRSVFPRFVVESARAVFGFC